LTAGESSCGCVLSGNCDSGPVAGEEGCKFDVCDVSWLTVRESIGGCISASCEFKVTTEEEEVSGASLPHTSWDRYVAAET
jgi:hypothetical protein